MTKAPNLLNDDGSASMATMLMSSHHAFRRDIAQFAKALESLATPSDAKAAVLRQEWQSFRGALHGHHSMEDAQIFPSLRGHRDDLAAVIDQLSQQHHAIDPLLEQGDRAFADTFDLPSARSTAHSLVALLREHLELEEAHVIPTLRGAKQFPAPGSDEEAAMYAQGFAWSLYGIAPEVIAKITELLPPNLVSRLPAARADFETRWLRTWGTRLETASFTSVPAL